ncbi:WD-repeat protein [Cylindrospermum sp. NIES-4074]|nr:WD-repeat protein [Cylindrospermum sp. NIES-4074]
MRSEVMREAISVLLGELYEWQTQENATRVSNSIVARLRKLNPEPGFQNSVQLEIKETLKKQNLVALLLKYIPSNCMNFESYTEWRVNKDKWDEWLKICWGYDNDTLSMLSVLDSIGSLDDFVESVEKLPIIQLVVPDKSKPIDQIVDYHTHSSALYPPSLQWAYWINTGNNYIHYINNYQKKYRSLPINDTTILEEYDRRSRLSHGYLRAARILIGAMRDFYEILISSNLPTSSNCDEPKCSHLPDETKCSELIEKVRDMVFESDKVTQEDLKLLLENFLPELKKTSLTYLSKSISVGENFEDEIYQFLTEERKCIAQLLWKAYHHDLGKFIQEVLLTYLRCKGAWFQLNSGTNLESLDTYSYVILQNNDLSIVADNVEYFQKFHLPMSKAVNRFYQETNLLKRVEVRLPYMKNKQDIPRNIEFLESIYANVDWDLVLTFPRYSFDDENHKNFKVMEEEYFDFIECVLRILDDRNNHEDRVDNKKVRVVGVDLVGSNQHIEWRYYAKLIKNLRNKIRSEREEQSCFITYHLDEQKSVAPLKEICEILTILEIGSLEGNDRISHGWSLLLERKNSSNKTEPIEIKVYTKEWRWMEETLKNFIGEFTKVREEFQDEVKKEFQNKVTKEFEELRNYATVTDNITVLHDNLMYELATSLQSLVRYKLIKRGILLEICPTSSWRLAGISLPTQHPVKSWIEAKGKVLVGTDNPAVFPCTIESEYYLLERIKEQSVMHEDTSQTSSEGKNYKWDVFLSHSSADKEKVREVARKFQDQGLQVWLDEEQIHFGDSVTGKIEEGVTCSKNIIVCLSPSLGKSNWCRAEYAPIINNEISRKGSIRVIPLVIESVEPANIPFFLIDKSRVKYSDPNDWQKLLRQLGQPDEMPRQIPTQEDVQTISPPTRDGSSGKNATSCLNPMEQDELMELMRQWLDRDQVGTIWYLTLKTKMDDTIPGKNKDQCIIELLEKTKRPIARNKLIQNLYKEHPDIANP